MNNSTRMPWVDTAKGLSIILVVMMYSAYNTGEYTGGVGFLHYVIGFATPFRMPEFFLISGLFLSQVIDRPWQRYIDRRVIHYLYFYVLWAVISIGLKIGIFSRDPAGMLHDLAMAVVQPYGVLWFIYMLAVFGLVARVLRELSVPHWIIIPAAAALQMWAPHSESYALTQFAAYFVFFYLGFVMAPLVFRLVAWTQDRPAIAVAGLAVWAVLNGLLVYSPGYAVEPVGMQMGLAAWPPLHLTLAVAGAVALCVAGGFLSKFAAMEWLRWLGEHSLVVYVAFTIPMSIFRGAALASGLLTDTGTLSLAVLLVSVISPVIVYFIVKRTGFGNFLFERPAWAHIDTPNSVQVSSKGVARPAREAA
ncbi:acyltransferase [Mesorhizobium sp. M1C.F.Ca.ET.193.01.1.1]|uniref:acyltransferase family protein n=2 Tax=Mesorhizobium TaxID=68287 RepID=UPI000FD34BEC|nr:MULTISPECIES: acyltransferase family protein [unclassified Mesorhizobium]TGT00200.1 acyltransferase [bacterium M00.F.Ca.ET.177.01.1.1]TGQ53605.1 acyltransferase [Mesorhizobium sp. M1C.F.Ca.ET.210.01.1.1]TGQ71637.1 acyltransferase [Mesorhizobium sp. M1C.F.Ca.ET.212.01.1.1]TGR08378.1 acyltransferase [Mesorhizobium sp. M1C.F.Ca.ET.204.01.1.1]TGR28619.1 acyltransferase [Mesorhizobium sp. M1C.F.Ca.ET.196.01.1.1]